MSWPKPVSQDPILAPQKIEQKHWILILLIMFFILSCTALFLFYGNHLLTQPLFWIGIVGLSLVSTGIAYSIRMYCYGLAQEKYEIWQQEEQNIEQNWQDWAMQSVVVLDSYYLVPNQLNVKKILSEGDNLESKVNKSLAFDEQERQFYFKNLFAKLQSTLDELPKNEKIDISYYSTASNSSDIDKNLATAYQAANIKQSFTLSYTQVSEVEIQQLEKFIDAPNGNPQLIIIDDTSSSKTAFFCAILLVDEDKYQLLPTKKGICQILRPMMTDNLSDDLALMSKRQPTVTETEHLWSANMSNNENIGLTKKLSEFSISPEKYHNLERLVGNQTALSYWLSLAFACEMTKITKKNSLIAAISQDKWLFSVVTGVK